MHEATDFIDSIEGEMTPEQVAKLVGLAEGDTAEADNDSVPAAVQAQEEVKPAEDQSGKGEPAAQEQSGEAGEQGSGEDVKPVLLARDNVHTIPYEKLEEARQGEKHWKAEAEAAQRELEELRAQAAQRQAAGEAPTQADRHAEIAQSAIDQGVDPGIFGDFSEEAMAQGIAKLTQQMVEARIAPLVQQLEPIKRHHEQDTTASHYAAIHAAHPDAGSIVESAQLADWINAQPSFVRDGFNQVLQQGTAEQIIELFDSYKSATGVATPAKQDVKAAAQAAIDGLQERVPTSLSDVPGGRAATSSRDEAMAGMDGVELINSMDSMTPEQIERYLNSL